MIQAKILGLGQRGEGFADIDGRRLYVPFALPGETVVLAEPEGDHAALADIRAPSPERAAPPCPYFTRCGGCAIQHMDGALYASFKRGLVETALRHAGLSAEVAPLVDARGRGRRRATLHVRLGLAGYMRARSHQVLDIDHCPILVPALAKAAPALARRIGRAVGDCDIAFTATLSGLDLDIRGDKPLRPQKLVPLAQTLPVARVTLDGELVLQTAQPLVAMGKARVDLPPRSFLQASDAAEDILAGLVVARLGKARAVADLFCGLGPFTLRLAEKVRVVAADSDKPGIAALQKAVRFTQGLKAVVAQRRDLFREPMTAYELEAFDAVVFDPPRAGAEAQSRELAKSRVKTVIAVSCDPRSFARDAAILVAGGYRLQQVVPVDQFAYSTHVELVAAFTR